MSNYTHLLTIIEERPAACGQDLMALSVLNDPGNERFIVHCPCCIPTRRIFVDALRDGSGHVTTTSSRPCDKPAGMHVLAFTCEEAAMTWICKRQAQLAGLTLYLNEITQPLTVS